MTDVLMPQMGESIVEGTVTKWLKKVGERVERDEPLFEISTDKVDSEVPAPVSGVLEQMLVEEGETVPINTVVAKIGDGLHAGREAPAEPAAPKSANGGSLSPEVASTAVASTQQPGAEAAAEPPEDGGAVRSSPLVRRLAKEHGIDLRQVKGTGQGGRISKKDIETYLKAREESASAPAAGLAAAAATPPAAELLEAPQAAPGARFGDYHLEPLSTMRKRIAQHMVLTKRVAPHVSTVHQVDVTAVATLREKVKDRFLERNGVKLTYMPFFLRAAASALKAFPVVNASLDGEQIVYHNELNIGIAVALPWGLVVPVIKDAGEKSIVELQRAVSDLASRARNKRLNPEEVRQGTFSISNYGAYGSLLGTPAINQPQSAILGLGAVHKAPLVINDAIAIRSISYVTLTFDHRLLDGAIADEFLNHLKAVIEEWSEPPG